MNPVSTRSATKSGCDRARTRNPALVLTGHASTAPHAAASLAAASCRVRPCTISLAISGS